MKKIYIAPQMEIVEIESEQPIAASGVSESHVGLSDNGFGGSCGSQRKSRSSIWDDEEEDTDW